MDEQQAYSSNIAAEAVGERLGNPPPDTREQAPRPPGASIKARGPGDYPCLIEQTGPAGQLRNKPRQLLGCFPAAECR